MEHKKKHGDEKSRINIIAVIRKLKLRGIDTMVVENAHYIVLDE
ncbi:hypothetical protein [Bacillus arachidis]|nr:hypothetical protein [Bacillus arachidis]